MTFPRLISLNLKRDSSFVRMAQGFLLTLLCFSTTHAVQLQSQVINITPSTLPKNAVRVPFISVNLKAIDGPVNLRSLTVQRSGLSSNDDFGRIWAESSNYRRTNARNLSNNDQVELNFRTPLTIEANQTTQITVYANLEFEQSGRTAKLNLVDISHDGEVFSGTPKSVAEPVIVHTKSRIPYNRSQYRIKCTNGQCRLVPRN